MGKFYNKILIYTGIIFYFSLYVKVDILKPDLKNSSEKDNLVFFAIDSVAGKVDLSRRLDFYYHDSLAFGHPVVIAGKNTKLVLNSPTLLFQSDIKQTPFLIYPEEKIRIRYSGSDSLQLYITGNVQRTNELNFFRALVQKTGNIYYAFQVMPYHKKVNTLVEIELLEKEISRLKIARLNFLENYEKRFFISKDFSKIAIGSIKSTALKDSILLYNNNRELLKNQNLYENFITEKMTSIKFVDFIPFQINLSMYKTLVSLATDGTANAAINSINDFTKRFNYISQNFIGATKDFLLANLICEAYTKNLTFSKSYLMKFNLLCKDEGYKKIVSERLKEKNSYVYAGKINKVLYTDGKTVEDLESVFSKNKGKLILIDFWASWCSPCRGEMPYFHKLKWEYENDDIVFVSVSSDAKISDWLKANQEESLNEKNSFLLLNFDKSSFVKKYVINSIPRYMLIGKDGKMISQDAPRPSDPKLKVLINSNL